LYNEVIASRLGLFQHPLKVKVVAKTSLFIATQAFPAHIRALAILASRRSPPFQLF
jgi:hypothetical protein